MDYSPFYFKNYYEKKAKSAKKRQYTSSSVKGFEADKEMPRMAEQRNNDFEARSQEEKTELNHNKATNAFSKGKRRGDKAGFFTAVIILLCFICVIFAAEFISGGVIVSGLKTAFNPSEGVKYYFLCTGEYDTELKAVKHAEAVRKKGGAGYLHVNEGQYYVVIATFLDKKSAKTVQGKNEGTKIFELETKPIKLSSAATEDKKLADKTRENVIEAVRELYIYANELDSGASKHSETMDKLATLRNDFLYLKEEVASSAMIAADKNNLFRLIDPVYGGLDSLFYETTGEFLSAAIRNITAGAVTAICY